MQELAVRKATNMDMNDIIEYFAPAAPPIRNGAPPVRVIAPFEHKFTR